MKKNELFRMRCTESFKKDIEYISKMEDTQSMSEAIELLVKNQLEHYKKLGIVRK